MGALALHGLNRPEPAVLGWYEHYCSKLDAIDTAPADYLEQLAASKRALAELGRDALLARELPALISGWTRNAFHPLIRLAYGYHFQIDGEIAAGLAYLKWCGPDATIERLARSTRGASEAQSIQAAFRSLEPCATGLDAAARFDDRVTTVLAQPDFTGVAQPYPSTLPNISRAALTLFDQTHDFFALHLVTGSHAFRCLYPFAGEWRDEVFSLGIFAAYAAVGAPGFKPDSDDVNGQGGDSVAKAADGLSRQLQSTDDHDIKLSYSAICQARHYEDRAYIDAASRYLDR